MIGTWQGWLLAFTCTAVLLFILWTIRVRRRTYHGRVAPGAVHAAMYDDMMRDVDLGAHDRSAAQALIRNCYIHAMGHFDSAETRMRQTHATLFRSDDHFLDIDCIGPEHINVRAGPAVTGTGMDEFISLTSHPALSSLVDAYYSPPIEFGRIWRSFPNRMSPS